MAKDSNDITKEQFFNNLKEAQKSDNAPHPSQSMRDNMEFLYRTGEYRGDRKLRYKTEKGVGWLSQKYVDAITSKPKLLAGILRKGGEKEINQLIAFIKESIDYRSRIGTAELFNRMFKEKGYDPNDDKQGSPFMENIKRIVTTICGADISRISETFGSEILQYIDADALFAVLTGLGSADIFFKAFISPSLFRVIWTAELSAKYSLFLDSASCKSLENIGASMINIIPISIIIAFPFESSSSLPLMYPLAILSAIMDTPPTITVATVDNNMS